MNFLDMVAAISPVWRQEVQERADREREVLRVMMLFPARKYACNPTFEQAEAFVDEAVASGYSTEWLYQMFAAGEVHPHIDAIIRKYAPGWRPYQ